MSISTPRGSEEGLHEILRVAAHCFMERGYTETSIDDVARRLGSTKGRIYHFFASKADLFFAVAEEGMDRNFAAIGPYLDAAGRAMDRLKSMALAHTMSMIENRAYQRSVWEGVAIHLRGATTPEQRDRLAALIAYRDSYSDRFRAALKAAKEEGDLQFKDAGIALQLMFLALNSPIFWYSPRHGETVEDRLNLAQQCVEFALRGLGAPAAMAGMTM
ncbi:MAG: hypothetical protein RLZZ444_4096 [Pseudomonadota bacterium]|jgi:AcrR family transcriptional regulator